MSTGFKFTVAKNILGVNTNIDHKNDAWMSMSQFNKYMGWHGKDAYIGGVIEGRENKPFAYMGTNGQTTYTIKKTGMWLLNADGIGHQLSCVQTLVGGELRHIKALFNAVHEWCDEFDAENAIARVKSALEERLQEEKEEESNATHVSESQPVALGLRVFEDDRFGQMRTVLRDGEIWFVAADVCRALEVQNSTQAIGRLDEDERAMLNIGRQGEANIVNEPGLYTLVLGSRKPEARAFKRWITHDVIPTLRKTGTYSLPNQSKESLFERMAAGCGAKSFSAEQATRLAFSGKESEAEGIYMKQRDFSKAVRKLIPVIALIKGGSATNYDTWCELYNRTQMVGNFDLFSRKESGLALIDLIRYREWWAVAFAITALCMEAGVNMEQYIDSQVACAFLCVWGYVTGSLTLAQAYQEQEMAARTLTA